MITTSTTKRNTFAIIKDDISEWDEFTFLKLVRTDISFGDVEIITRPNISFKEEQHILAVHWHPEYIPMECARKRIQRLYPSKSLEIIIPTQHNCLAYYEGYCGVEVDCYAKEFNRQIQLLLHFTEEKAQKATKLKDMLEYTNNYRLNQLFEFIETFVNHKFENRLHQAIKDTALEPEILYFTKMNVKKVSSLIEKHYEQIPREMFKNKLILNYFLSLGEFYEADIINKCRVFLSYIEKNIKKDFSVSHFFNVHDIIDETKQVGGCIVVPHPEQFWPILLANYDVDGYEVWNPLSSDFTEFLIKVICEKNNTERSTRFLPFMGDDTHLSEKIKDLLIVDPVKANSEIGFQPGWFNLCVKNQLKDTGFTKETIIQDYISRLNE